MPAAPVLRPQTVGEQPGDGTAQDQRENDGEGCNDPWPTPPTWRRRGLYGRVAGRMDGWLDRRLDGRLHPCMLGAAARDSPVKRLRQGRTAPEYGSWLIRVMRTEVPGYGASIILPPPM